jgi:hypothetical protein
VSEARRHAVTASELLAQTERFADRLASLTPDEHLQMVTGGGFGRANADLHWTVELAVAHALAAIALSHTDADG